MNYVSTCCPKPVMLTTKFKREKFYLMSVTKFTNLSGNQVPLVLFHINSVNIILKKKYKVKMIKRIEKSRNVTVFKKKKKINKISIPLPFSPFFSSSAGSPHPVKVHWVPQHIPESIHQWHLWQLDLSSLSLHLEPPLHHLLLLQLSDSI